MTGLPDIGVVAGAAVDRDLIAVDHTAEGIEKQDCIPDASYSISH